MTMEPIHIPITDVLDLHQFRPAEVADLLDDYFRECISAGILSVRIIHGKGAGLLRRRVHTLLARHPLVGGFYPAPPPAGGWGATVVSLSPSDAPAAP
ncbi:MAG: Smr/MutS family protein [Pseudomonadota bacterium]